MLVKVKCYPNSKKQEIVKKDKDSFDIKVKENNSSDNYEFFSFVSDNSQMELEFGVMETELDMAIVGNKVEIKGTLEKGTLLLKYNHIEELEEIFRKLSNGDELF